MTLCNVRYRNSRFVPIERWLNSERILLQERDESRWMNRDSIDGYPLSNTIIEGVSPSILWGE